jgi:protein-S-isoprenylcysteine O-methyltransferase Ste14
MMGTAIPTRRAAENGSLTLESQATAAKPAWVVGALDVAERGLLLAMCVWLVARILAAYLAEGGVGNLILLPSEGLVVLFVLIRRSTRKISQRPWEWVVAFLATLGPLLVQPASGGSLLPPALGGIMMLAGMLVQMHAKVMLGRSFGCVPANRGLKFSGPYRFVRHPMYTGYLVTHVGFLLMNPTLWNLGLYASCYVLQVYRILAEERLLKNDLSYLNYTAAVRYRLIPLIF